MTSQITPAGVRPASRARSTAASVWPVRSSTPPGLDFSGKTWPGWTRSRGRAAGSIATWIVRARSAAEMPVVTPSRASIETVNGVWNGDSFLAAIRSSPSSSQRSGRQRQADQPAAVRGHEVDRLGRDELRRHREVALVLAVLVVAHHDHAAGADLLDRLFDRRERRSCDRHQLLDVLGEHVHLQVDRRAGQRRRRGWSARESRGSATPRTCPRLTDATVSETPSTAIEPFSTT